MISGNYKNARSIVMAALLSVMAALPLAAPALAGDCLGCGTSGASYIMSGNVGIGTASPVVALDVTGASRATTGLFAQGTYPTLAAGAGVIVDAPSAAYGRIQAYNFTGPATLPLALNPTGGNVGIGTTSPGYPFDIYEATSFPVRLRSSSYSNGWVIGPYSANNYFYIITEAGGSAGVYLTNGGTSWVANSDRRLKTNIVSLPDDDGLDAVMKLRPVTYNWIDQRALKDTQYGFIAQDVEKVMPHLVSVGKDTTIIKPNGTQQTLTEVKGLDYTGFVVPLVKAVQELKALFDSDHGTLVKLEADNDNLRARVDALEAARH